MSESVFRFCSISGCDNPGVVCVGGCWYCFVHKPILFSDEDVRYDKSLE